MRFLSATIFALALLIWFLIGQPVGEAANPANQSTVTSTGSSQVQPIDSPSDHRQSAPNTDNAARESSPVLGQVELRFMAGGKPVAGEKIIARLISFDGQISSDAQCDDQGVCIWSDVQTGSYQWELISAHHAEMNPPYSSGVALVNGAVFSDGQRHPSNRSGNFNVALGETLRLDVELTMAGTIFGFTEPKARVFISHRKDLAGDLGGTSARMYDIEVNGYADETGFFEFRNLIPGTKLVRVEWAKQPQLFFFATTSVEVVSGGKHDLGRLQSGQGSLSGKLVFKDASGRQVDGTQAFGKPVQSEVVFASRPTVPEEGMMMTKMLVTVGEEFTITGLFGGDYTIHYSSSGWGWPEEGPMKVDEDRPVQRKLFIPPGSDVRLEFPIQVSQR